jgi:AraC-like DNA-binding protein
MFGIYQYQRKIILKKRFNKLVNTNEVQEQKTEIIKDKKTIDIPDAIVSSITSNLEKFEAQQQYLNIDLNLNELAAQFNTNTKYLSKTINYYKQQSFSNYIKNLRITYAFNILKEKKEIRRYTIKAIANECGFKGAESFSKTFNKKYGIYPSYFIKQLEKSE